MREYGKRNSVKVDRISLLSCEYFYVDSLDRRSDKLFIRSRVPVKFKDDFTKDGWGFVVVSCSFRKKYERAFLDCMADLERTMLLESVDGYERAVETFRSIIGQ